MCITLSKKHTAKHKVNMNNPPKVLISAYACSPGWGSELGLGWNWVNLLSEHFETWVLTDEIYAAQCRDYLTVNKIEKPLLHVVGITRPGGHSCRLWGYFWLHYLTQNLWQRKAYKIAKALHAREHFDLVHRLNMIGYREPGYLWKMDGSIPYVWGPISGYAQIPVPFLSLFDLKNRVAFTLRNTINHLQMRTGLRVRKAMMRANLLLAATRVDQDAIRKHYRCESVLMGETGTSPVSNDWDTAKHADPTRPLELIWIGTLTGGKALPLGLLAMQKVRQQDPNLRFRLRIIGAGPCEQTWKALAGSLGLDDVCSWLGRIPHEQALGQISASDAMLFTSLKEATSAVVMEAVQKGVPVICHDACGMGTVITTECGIKVPMIDPKTSVIGFADAISALCRDRLYLSALARGAQARAQELTWASKGEIMVKLYEDLLASDKPKTNR